MTHSHARSGFSIMELIFYLAIVGAILGIVFGLVPTLMYRTKVTKTDTNMQLVKSSIESYYARNDEYPSRLQDLKPRYFKKIPQDGWGNPFVYKVTEGGKHPYELYSYGYKGPGGGDKLSVWKK